MRAEIEMVLARSSSAMIATGLLDEFLSLQRNFALKQWRYSGLDAGHFVEWSRRHLEHLLGGNPVPLSGTLPKFNDGELKRLEGLSGDDGLRKLVPRALFLVYTMRNKRGIGHLSQVAANGADAALIFSTCKWTLTEFLRVNSSLSIDVTSRIVDRLSERHIDGFWSDEGVERVLHVGLVLREQVLFYLFNRSPSDIDAISAATGSTAAYVRRIARDLDKRRLIVFDSSKSSLTLLPTGEEVAKKIIEKEHIV